MADVSVVMPVGRIDAFLPAQLEALGGQSYGKNFELVLSLNSNNLEHEQALRNLLKDHSTLAATVVDSSDIRSASHARNVGAEKASGSVLLFCDGDDIADRFWIERMVEALEYYDAVGGFLDEELLAVPGQEHWRPPATPQALPQFLGHDYLVSANMGVKRLPFEAVGGFDVGLTRGEDIAFSWALLDHGVQLGYCGEAIMYYRHRRGIRSMMHQHYLYGIGFSQILARRGLPGEQESNDGLGALRPNGQSVDRMTAAYFLRRASIATGRVVGLVSERAQRPEG